MSNVGKSPWIIHYDGSSCNGCDIEVLAALTPLYDAERFGVVNTGNPKHADIFVVTGGINDQNAPVVKQIYDQMLEPKVVVACGAMRLRRRRLPDLLQHQGRRGHRHPGRCLRTGVRRQARVHPRRGYCRRGDTRREGQGHEEESGR